MPSSVSWLNLVDVHFGIIKRQTLLRADVALVPELNKTIRDFVTGWSDRCHTFYEDQDQRRYFQETQPLNTSKMATRKRGILLIGGSMQNLLADEAGGVIK